MNLSHTILIIDDEVQIRRLLEISLSAHGYNTFFASNGQEGLIAAATHNPSLIILDLGLPDIDGLELVVKNSGNGFPNRLLYYQSEVLKKTL